MGAWVIGHNIAGYLPESDTYACASWDEAWRSLRDEMERYADQDDDAAWATLPEDAADDDYPVMRAVVDSILTDDGPDKFPEQDWSAWAEDGDGRHIVFWLRFSSDADPDEED